MYIWRLLPTRDVIHQAYVTLCDVPRALQRVPALCSTEYEEEALLSALSLFYRLEDWSHLPKLKTKNWSAVGSLMLKAIEYIQKKEYRSALTVINTIPTRDQNHWLLYFKAWTMTFSEPPPYNQASEILDLLTNSGKQFQSAARSYALKGYIHGTLEEIEEEEYYCKKALELEPMDVTVWNNLGTAYHARGRLGDALRCYDKALQINSQYKLVLRNKRRTLIQRKDYAEALKICKQVVDMGTDELDDWIIWGRTLRQAMQYDHAWSVLHDEKMIQLAQNKKRMDEVFIERATLHGQKEPVDWNLIDQNCDLAIKLCPSLQNYKMKAAILADLERIDEASQVMIDYQEKVIQRLDVDASILLISFWMHSKERNKCADWLNLLLEAEPNNLQAIEAKIEFIIASADRSQQKFVAENVAKFTTLRLNKFGSITNEGASMIAEFLEESNSIVELDLSGNNFEADGITEILKSLQKNHSLTSIDLSNGNSGNYSIVDRKYVWPTILKQRTLLTTIKGKSVVSIYKHSVHIHFRY
jgi:tetratricopeptide (TPR) repeat protein